MQKTDAHKLVFSLISSGTPKASHSDWRTYINQYIVPEVKQESLRFYGSIDEPESLYAGLDYTNANHQMRLAQFPAHRQLFQAFDELGLTNGEIYSLCRWQGTRRSKDEYERKYSVAIEDTTWEGLHIHQPELPTLIRCDPMEEAFDSRPRRRDFMERMEERVGMEVDSAKDDKGKDLGAADPSHRTESDDVLQQSVGWQLNQRLMARADSNYQAAARGQQTMVDEDFDQWLSETFEQDTLHRYLDMSSSSFREPENAMSTARFAL